MKSSEFTKYSVISRNSFNDRDILIIEDSEQSSLRINSLLNKMGFKKIHLSHTAASGLYQFEELIKAGKTPIVFLDFLPETDILSIVKIIHQIYLETKIILFSRYESHDEKIIKMISDGIYRSLKTPISQNDINQLMHSIESDESCTDIEPLVDLKLEELLTRKSTITIEDIKECGIDSDEEINRIIQDLKNKNFVMEKNDVTLTICTKCASTNLSSNHVCVTCHKSKFQKNSLIEHYDCGNISSNDTYVSDVCPYCRKSINALGVDYRILKNFVCLECGSTFSEPKLVFNCNQCKHNFELNDANWKITKSYSVL